MLKTNPNKQDKKPADKPIGDQPVWQGAYCTLSAANEVLEQRVITPLTDPLAKTLTRGVLGAPLVAMDYVEHYDAASRAADPNPALTAAGKTAAEYAVYSAVPTPLTIGAGAAKIMGQAIADVPEKIRATAATIEGTTVGANMLRNSLNQQADEAEITSRLLQAPAAVLDATADALWQGTRAVGHAVVAAFKDSGKEIAQQEMADELARQEALKLAGGATRELGSQIVHGIHQLGTKISDTDTEMCVEGMKMMGQNGLAAIIGRDLYSRGLDGARGALLQSVSDKKLAAGPVSSESFSSLTKTPGDATAVLQPAQKMRQIIPPSKESPAPPSDAVPPSHSGIRIEPVLNGLSASTVIGGAITTVQATTSGATIGVSVPLTTLAIPAAIGGGIVAFGGLIYDNIKHGYHHARELSPGQVRETIQQFEREHAVALGEKEKQELTPILQGLHAADQEVVNAENRLIRRGRFYRVDCLVGHKKREARQLKQKYVAVQQNWQQKLRDFDAKYSKPADSSRSFKPS